MRRRALPFPTNETGAVHLLYNPYQQAFRQALAQRLPDGTRAFKRLTVLAGRRGGKTLIGALGAVEEWKTPGTRGFIIAPTYGDLHKNILPTIFSLLPDAWIESWSEKHQELILVNKSVGLFVSGEDPERFRGPGADFIWPDEVRSIPRTIWETARPMLTERQGAAFFTTTTSGFNWIYHHLWVPAHPGVGQRKGYWATRYRTIDNPIITQEEVEEARATMDAAFFRQEYEADFVQFEGAIYGEAVQPAILRTEDQVKSLFPDWPTIPSSYALIIGIDPGADHPFAAVALVVHPKGLVAVGEYLERMGAFIVHAPRLKILAQGFTNVRWAADRTAVQAMIELAQHGIICQPSESSVGPGIQRVQAWLRSGQLFLIESRVPRLIEQLSSYHWKAPTGLSGELRSEQPFKLNDDLPDALRYAIMAWPELPEVQKPAEGRDRSAMPPDVRWAYERLQRIERAEAREPGELDWSTDLSPMGDFFAAN